MISISVCILIKNNEKYIKFLDHIFHEIERSGMYNLYYYFYENDSTDNSVNEINKFLKNRKGKLLSENLPKIKFKSISFERGKFMAQIRNKLKQFHGKLDTDYTLLLDTDVVFTLFTLEKFILDLGKTISQNSQDNSMQNVKKPLRNNIRFRNKNQNSNIINFKNSPNEIVMVSGMCLDYNWFPNIYHYYDTLAFKTYNQDSDFSKNDNTCLFKNCLRCRNHRKNKKIKIDESKLFDGKSNIIVKSAFGSMTLIKTDVYNKVQWNSTICEHHSFCNNVNKYGKIIVDPNVILFNTVDKQNYFNILNTLVSIENNHNKWKYSSRNFSINNNVISSELLNVNGKWVKSQVSTKLLNLNKLENINGNFKYVLCEEEYNDYSSIIPLKNIHLNKNIIFFSWYKRPPDYIFYRWKNLNPNYDFNFSLNKDCESLLSKKFNNSLRDKFINFEKGCTKCDLWRLCKLYLNGGTYADVDLVPNINLESLDTNISFYSIIDDGHNGVFQAFIKVKNSKDRLILGLLLSFLNTETNFEKRRKIRGFNTQNWPTYNMYDTISYSLGIDKILPHTKYDLENVKVKINIGTSNNRTKVINILYFPEKVEYLISLCKNPYKDSFSFKIENNNLIVTRTDEDHGWEYNHYCDLILSYNKSIYFFKEKIDNNQPISEAYVSDANGEKIFKSRDLLYMNNDW